MATNELVSGNATMNFRSASRLQMIKIMKLWVVTIVAVVAASGCGVGVDDPEYAAAMASSGAALEQDPSVGADPVTPSAEAPQTPATATPSVIRDPSTVALPQDPIPVFEGKPMGGGRGPMPGMDQGGFPPPPPGPRPGAGSARTG